MKTVNIANRDARRYVNALQPFKGSNMFAEDFFGIYAIYSYGYHFPMYVRINNKWYGNSDRYSSSTSRQMQQTKPDNVHEWVDTGKLRTLVDDARTSFRNNVA